MHCFRLLDSKLFSSLIKGYTYENKSIMLRSLCIQKKTKKLEEIMYHNTYCTETHKKAACIIL